MQIINKYKKSKLKKKSISYLIRRIAVIKKIVFQKKIKKLTNKILNIKMVIITYNNNNSSSSNNNNNKVYIKIMM